MELRQRYMCDNYKYEQFENKHKGETLYIISTGASLRDFDWNKIRYKNILAFNKCVFHIPYWPLYYFIWDKNGNEQNIYNLMDFAPLIKFSKTQWVKVKRLPMGDKRLFSKDGIARAGSSAIYSTELALFMGFDKIIILGQDLYIDEYYSFWQSVPTPAHFRANKTKWFGRELLNEFKRFAPYKDRVFIGHSPRSLIVTNNVLNHVDI